MKCQEIEQHIDLLLDGELTPTIDNQVRAHSVQCVACRCLIEQRKALHSVLRAYIPPVPSDDFDARVIEAFQLRHQSPSRPVPTRWSAIFAHTVSVPLTAVAVAAVCVAVLCFASAYLGRITAAPVVINETATNLESLVLETLVSPQSDSDFAPRIVERLKVIHVPVVQERVVTRRIFVENSALPNKPKSESPLPPTRRAPVTPKADALAWQIAVNDKGYVTRADLTGFQMATEMRPRIINEKEKADDN